MRAFLFAVLVLGAIPAAMAQAPAPSVPSVDMAPLDGALSTDPQPAPAIRTGPRSNVFAVSGIAVDASRETTSQAREAAFADGQRLALQKLLVRLGGDRALSLAPLVGSDALSAMIAGLQVADERTAPGRYLADLTYNFRPAAVRELLEGNAVPYTELVSKEVLVLPILDDATGQRLWEEPNPWFDAWLDYAEVGRLVPILVPFGELDDLRDVTIEDALAGNSAALRAIAQRYGVGDVVVAMATPGSADLTLNITRYPETGGASTSVAAVPSVSLDDLGPDAAGGGEEEAQRATLAAAVAGVADEMEAQWRQQTVVASQVPSVLLVRVPIAQPADWFGTWRGLARVPTIRGATLLSLSVREALVDISFVGSAQQLNLALAQEDLALVRDTIGPAIVSADLAASFDPFTGFGLGAPSKLPAGASTSEPIVIDGLP